MLDLFNFFLFIYHIFSCKNGFYSDVRFEDSNFVCLHCDKSSGKINGYIIVDDNNKDCACRYIDNNGYSKSTFTTNKTLSDLTVKIWNNKFYNRNYITLSVILENGMYSMSDDNLKKISIQKEVVCPTLEKIQKYLNKNNWIEIRENKGSYYSCYSKNDIDIEVPKMQSFEDFHLRVRELITDLSYAEDRSQSDIYSEIINGD